MTRPYHLSRVQLDGPVLPPSRRWSQRNWGLLGLLLPVLLAPLVSGQPYGTSWSWLLALAAGLAAMIFFAPAPRQAIGEMDWAVTAVLAGLMVAAPSWRTMEMFLAPTVGFFCGLVCSQARAAYLLGRPGLISWLALCTTLNVAGAAPAASAGAPPGLLYGFFDWPFICALVAAGFCFATGRTSPWYWGLPWLALLAAVIAFPSHQGAMQMGPPLYRAAALSLPIFFIAPQMARRRLELLIYEGLLILMLLYPFPRLGWITDPTLLWSGLIFLPRWHLDRRRRRRPEAASGRPSESNSAARAALKCGHLGTSALLAEWLGPPSCRLADLHDEGPRSCPYGCLALGDCFRACPNWAISLTDGFPVIDPELCRGCGQCQAVCPKGLFELNEGRVRAFIPCASRSGLKKNAGYCEKSCLGCGKCRKACPARAIGRHGDGGAMRVDQEICRAYGEDCGQVCRTVCPRRIISEK